MKHARVAWVLLIATALGLLAGTGCRDQAPTATEPGGAQAARVERLRAFAKLYGYIRYFHPSDEASAVDWDRLAVHGAGRVARTRDPADLRQVLEELFVPVAPTLRIFGAGERPPEIALPAATAEALPVAWHHVGYGLSARPTVYRSARTNRPSDGRSRSGPGLQGPLFGGGPRLGELVTRPLGAGLSCRFPLVLPTAGGHTWGPARRALEPLQRALAGVDPAKLTGDDERLRLADVVVAWNVFQHFYPYFDVVRTDWNLVLTGALERALADRSHADFVRTLRWLVAQAQDGHGNVRDPQRGRVGWVPWRLEWVEDEVVVAAADPETTLRAGDVVQTIDGQPARALLRRQEDLVSGSPQWRRHRALDELTDGPPGPIAVTVRRGGASVTLRLQRQEQREGPARPGEPVRKLEGGAWYVDLDRAAWEQIAPRLAEIAAAPGVVFDLRGYPRKDNQKVIEHLLREDDRSDAWMQVPKIARPDREGLVGYQDFGWKLKRQEPHIGGRVAFITGPQAISAAESFMGFIEHYRLGEIVGQPTAGTNGNINRVDLPGGFALVFTGMKVRKHDGSQLHHVGIRPTVPVERTIEGLRSGRDEALEAALRLVSGKS